jgi:opacity protein-like surface antigen
MVLAGGLCAPVAVDAQVRGFADVGVTRFTAARSFATILGTNSGPVVGGGVEVALPRNLFVSLRASRFSHDGHRVFLFEGTQFDLDVDTTVTITPLEVSAGYRYDGLRNGRGLFGFRGFTPYAGGGVGWHRYKETSTAADESENVDDRFLGYQLLGGGEVRVTGLVAAAVEGEWSTVPNGFSDDNGVAAAFDEHNLGGFTVRVKVVIGR